RSGARQRFGSFAICIGGGSCGGHRRLIRSIALPVFLELAVADQGRTGALQRRGSLLSSPEALVWLREILLFRIGLDRLVVIVGRLFQVLESRLLVFRTVAQSLIGGAKGIFPVGFILRLGFGG